MFNENLALTNAIRKYSLKAESEELISLAMDDDETIDEHIKLLIAKAFDDNSSMLIALADHYSNGRILKKDEVKSINLYEHAYNDGNINGCLKLGVHHYVNDNYMKAIEFLTECLRHENDLTEGDLGYCNAVIGDSYARIASPNMSRAKEHLETAAEKYNDAYAGYRLGAIYSNKNSDIYDSVKSMRYYELGAKNGSIPAIIALAEKYAFGDEDAGIKPNKSEAISVLENYPNSDEIEIYELLGRVYLLSYDDERPNYLKAKAAFEKVLEISCNYYKEGYIEHFLGYACYMESDYGEYDEAIRYLMIADRNGYCSYSAVLGHICKEIHDRDGSYDLHQIVKYFDNAYREESINLFQCAEYVEILSEYDYKKAYEVAEYGISIYNDVVFYLSKAKLVLSDKVTDKITKREAAEIMEDLKRYNSVKREEYVLLGNYYVSVMDYRLAEQNFYNAFQEGESEAGLVLARLYEKGAGSIQANVQTAVEWYRRAANAGNEEAKKELSCFTEKMFGGYKRVRSI